MSGWECARGTFAMHQHVAKLGVPLFLHQVVADLVDQLQVLTEDLAKCLRDLLKDHQAI